MEGLGGFGLTFMTPFIKGEVEAGQILLHAVVNLHYQVNPLPLLNCREGERRKKMVIQTLKIEKKKKS